MTKAGIFEGQTFSENKHYDVDVVVVGTGPGGAVCAERFAAAGLKTLVVEEGGYFTKERFRMQESDCYPHLYQESAQRTTKNRDVAILQGRALGGGTAVNWTTSYRTPKDVVERWQQKHKATGVRYEDLEPHWDVIEKRLNVHRTNEGGVNKNNRMILDGCRALGFEAHLLKRNVRGCAQTGYCGFGCPIDAKQSTLVTLIPDAVNLGATVISRASVDALIIENKVAVGLKGRFKDALGRNYTGPSFTVRAKRVVLSAGAIGSPSILLRSNAPDPYDVLGRRTFLHPVISSVGVFDEVVNPFYGAPQSVASHHFAQRENEVGYFIEAIPLHPVIAASYVPGFGDEGMERLKKLAHYAPSIALAIDGHHDDVPGGRVGIMSDGSPYLDYVVARRVQRAFKHAQKNLARIQLAGGAKAAMTLHRKPLIIKSEKDIAQIDELDFGVGQCTKGSAHQMGGCAMGEDPSLSVVNSTNFEHHQLQNLHVVDGSLFPTSLGVNPQESIFGLARLAATRIASKGTKN